MNTNFLYLQVSKVKFGLGRTESINRLNEGSTSTLNDLLAIDYYRGKHMTIFDRNYSSFEIRFTILNTVSIL